MIDDLASGWQFPLVTVADGTLRTIANKIHTTAPHYLIVVGWSRIVAPDVLDIPRELWGNGHGPRNTERYGNVGMHPSPLPLGRGQAPIPWTLIKGLTHTALSTFFLEDLVDSGAIVHQDPLEVREAETASSLFVRFADLHFHAGRRLAAMLGDRKVSARNQREADAVVWSRRRPADSQVDWRQSPDAIERFVRAQQWPYPLPFLPTVEGPVRIVSCRVQDRPGGSAGQILEVHANTVVLSVNGGVVRFVVAGSDCELAHRQLGAGHWLTS
jgi:methionyl-tRNA formyltransferase